MTPYSFKPGDTDRNGLSGFAIAVGFALLSTVVLGPLIYLLVQEQAEWNAFAAEHECKVVGRASGDVATSTGLVINQSGQVSTVTTVGVAADKTGYLCNDGVTYWR